MANGILAPQRKRHSRRQHAWRIAALLLLLIVGTIGCSPLATLGFLVAPWAGGDPPCPLTLPDKESKVAIICVHEDPAGTNIVTFRNADQDIAQLLASSLDKKMKENKEKVKIIPAAKVRAYIRDHADWITQSKQELGKHLDADLLVYLELGPMTLYEAGSSGTLYHGNVPIHLTVFDVNQTDGNSPKYEQYPTCTYPSSHPEDATSVHTQDFRAKFYERIIKDLMPYFVTQPQKDKMSSD